MVHVTFNEKVECHQYSPIPTHTEEMQSNNRNNDRSDIEGATSSSVPGQSRIKYNITFLKDLRDSALSQACPDVVTKGIEGNKEWAGKEYFPLSSARPILKGSVFSRQPYPQNFRPRGRLVPFFTNNQTNYGCPNRENELAPLEPIGSNRYQSRHYPSRGVMQDYGNNVSNRNLLPQFAQRGDARSSADLKSEEEPEWYISGPTSPNDFVELHGFDGPENQENHPRNDQFGCVDGNISGGPTSGASSNNGSPPAKSTPAKNNPHGMNDAQRNKRPAVGRSNKWQNSFDNRQSGGAPFLNEFFKNFAGAQNQSNLRGLTPIVRVEDVESSLLYDRLKFRQMVAQMHTQNVCRNLLYPQYEPVPNASQVLSEIDKILRTSTEEVYKRPEVRSLIKNIVEAVIPPINILNLLKNPLTEPQDRETIQSALKLITQAKQNATIAMKTHKPTESELRAHMDAILQDAIIKKKMENLSNELLKGSYSQGGRNFPNQSFQQLFQQNTAGRFENYSQGDSRGHCQSVENGKTLAQENNLNRWFSSTLLNKGPSGALPQIPIDTLRSEELESKIKQNLKVNEKEVK